MRYLGLGGRIVYLWFVGFVWCRLCFIHGVVGINYVKLWNPCFVCAMDSLPLALEVDCAFMGTHLFIVCVWSS